MGYEFQYACINSAVYQLLMQFKFSPYTHNCQYVMLQVFRHSLVYNFVDLVHRLFFVKISLKR